MDFTSSLLWIVFMCLLVPIKATKGKIKGSYDYIIVGGGTSGCVLANRLSEDPDVSVLLLEAGEEPPYPFVQLPLTFLDASSNPDTDWGFLNQPQAFTGPTKRTEVLQAKMLGGGSSHNAGAFIRGSPHDYNNWATRYGNTGWSYKDVLPYFKKWEDMADPQLAQNGFHGVDGPMKTRIAYSDDITDDVIQGAVEAGFKELSDYNGPDMMGIGRLQQMVDPKGQQMNTFNAFLQPVLARRNLHVKTEAFVTKVKLVNKKNFLRAKGVFVHINGKQRFIRAAQEVILSAGTINSPKILMLSGVGPRQHLQDQKINVLVDLPVGENLQDHSVGFIRLNIDQSASCKRRKLYTFEALFEYIFTGKGPWSTVSSAALLFQKTPSQPHSHLFPHIEQMYMLPLTKFDQELVASIRNGSGIIPQKLKEMQESENGPCFVDVFTLILHPEARGTVKLQSDNPDTHPIINYPYFNNQADIQDFIEGVRMIQRVLNSRLLQEGGLSMSGPHPDCTGQVYDTDAYWTCYLRANILSFHHCIGTCKMANDKSGVVDNELRVKGVKGLRVVDASVMPDHVSGQTSSTVMMIAEKAADIIKTHRKHR